jgi:transposase
MYRVDMYYTIKTLLKRGHSQRQISKELGIHRSTVLKIKTSLEEGLKEPLAIQKGKKLSPYHSGIEERSSYQSARLIYEWLRYDKAVEVSYATVARYVQQFKIQEVYVPLHSDPGEEGQVDFGYFGRYDLEGRLIKVWVFCMVLSHSRYAYYCLVRDQSVRTFIQCHILAFEFFGGVPQTVKIDNLKAGVITPDFYEPVIQHQYGEFLAHYGSMPITARPRRGQDKGKVESGVKYVKNNFLKRHRHKDYRLLEAQLYEWRDAVCNKRCHGTTRRVPLQVYRQTEKISLKSLPPVRYELFDICERKVDRMGHISYLYNHYSVPSEYAAQQLHVRCNGAVVRIYKDDTQVAIHSLCAQSGHYITTESHKPPYKQSKSENWYREQIELIGPDASQFFEALKAIRPRHWHAMIKGILSLARKYDSNLVALSCKRAVEYGALSYQEVKSILENRTYDLPAETSLEDLGGHGQELAHYDQLIN